MGDSFFTQISRVEAAHQLSQTFERELDHVDMVKFYRKAMIWHKQEAARYKNLLSKVASRLVEDSDDENSYSIWRQPRDEADASGQKRQAMIEFILTLNNLI